MKRITTQQLKCIAVLMNNMHIVGDDKDIMLLGFTSGRSSSRKDLTFHEAADLIKHLKQTDPNAPASEKMRKKIISMAHELHWKQADSKADMKRIDDWCKKYGYKHKSLDNYSYHELPTLVSQFEKMYQDFLNKL